MFQIEILALLLVVGLSTQNAIRFTLFDNTINTINEISLKCQTAMTEKTSEVQTCANNLGLKYAEKIQKDLTSSDFEALNKDVCALINDEEIDCVTLVKGQCNDEEIALIDKLFEQSVELQLKQQLGIDINCSN